MLSWLFPTSTAMERAAELQRRIILDDVRSETDPDPDATRRASIHTRQDIVLLVSLAKDQHRQAVNISRGVWLCALVLMAIANTLSR